jgi:hypothetical protein
VLSLLVDNIPCLDPNLLTFGEQFVKAHLAHDFSERGLCCPSCCVEIPLNVQDHPFHIHSLEEHYRVDIYWDIVFRQCLLGAKWNRLNAH